MLLVGAVVVGSGGSGGGVGGVVVVGGGCCAAFVTAFVAHERHADPSETEIQGVSLGRRTVSRERVHHRQDSPRTHWVLCPQQVSSACVCVNCFGSLVFLRL